MLGWKWEATAERRIAVPMESLGARTPVSSRRAQSIGHTGPRPTRPFPFHFMADPRPSRVDFPPHREVLEFYRTVREFYRKVFWFYRVVLEFYRKVLLPNVVVFSLNGVVRELNGMVFWLDGKVFELEQARYQDHQPPRTAFPRPVRPPAHALRMAKAEKNWKGQEALQSPLRDDSSPKGEHPR